MIERSQRFLNTVGIGLKKGCAVISKSLSESKLSELWYNIGLQRDGKKILAKAELRKNHLERRIRENNHSAAKLPFK